MLKKILLLQHKCNTNNFLEISYMKKEILEALTTKFQGVSSSVLDRIATKLAKTVNTAEEVQTAIDGVTIQQVIDSYTDSRVTEASETARKNAVNDYETRYGLKNGAKAENNEEQNTKKKNAGGDDETPSWAKALMDRISQLETAKATDSRKQQLNAVIGKLPAALRKPYERIALDNFKGDDDFKAFLGEVTTEVESIAKETGARGGVIGRPTTANAGGNQQTALTDEQKAAISHREGAVSTEGQPF